MGQKSCRRWRSFGAWERYFPRGGVKDQATGFRWNISRWLACFLTNLMMVRNFFSCQAMKGNGRVGWVAGLAEFMFFFFLASHVSGGGVGSQGLARTKRRGVWRWSMLIWLLTRQKRNASDAGCWNSDGNGLNTRNDFPLIPQVDIKDVPWCSCISSLWRRATEFWLHM